MRQRGSDAARRLGRAAACALALCVGAGPARGDSLIEAWTKAYLGNPTLAAQRAQLRATDERVPQALSGWRPTVQAGATLGVNRIDDNIARGVETGRRDTLWPETYSLSMRQPLYRGGRTAAGTSRAEADVEAQRAQLLATEQQVLLDVGSVYMNVLRDRAVVDLNINSERVLQRQLEATRDRFSVGEVTRTDVAQAEARRARARADRIQAEGNLEVSRAVYERLVGDLPGALEPPPAVLDLPDSEAAAIAAAQEDNPTLLANRFAERAALANTRLVQGELYPSVNLNALVQRANEGSVANSRVDQTQLVTEITVPLYQAGAVTARLREAKEIATQQRIQAEAARRQAIEAASQAWEDIETARARIVSLDAEIRASEIALEGVEQEALVGTRTVLDVLDAEQELLDARVNLVRSQRDLVVAAFRMAAATGRLTAERLNLPVEYYDPNVHYEAVRDRWWGMEAAPAWRTR